MSDGPKDPNRQRTVLTYRCEKCRQTEYVRVAEKGDRKRRGYCKNCKLFIYPVEEKKIIGKTREFKSRAVPSLW